MDPDPGKPDYEIEIIQDGAVRDADDPETENIEEDGDPIGDNFA